MRRRRRYFAWKRAADLVLSSAVLMLLGPVMALTALVVKVSSPGPVLYRARRVGQYGQLFEMLKFRTMVVNADKIGPAVTAGDDPRITRVGAILRKTKLDELPQFINVLRGEMSVVGPRPNVAELIARYQGEDREILQVPQGITDWSSLWFRRQEALLSGTDDVMADYDKQVDPIKRRLGRYYAQNGSLRDDARIFVATFLAVFFKKDPAWAFPSEAAALTLEVVEGGQSERLLAA